MTRISKWIESYLNGPSVAQSKVDTLETEIKALRALVAKHRDDVNAKERELRSKEAEYRHLRRLANQARKGN